MKYFEHRAIIIRTQFTGYHKYENAPIEVEFLQSLHRHTFHVEMEIEVFHDDRELEFFIVQKDLNRFIESYIQSKLRLFPSTSCEMIAESIVNYAQDRWPHPLKGKKPDTDKFKRAVEVTVFEDNENGSRVYKGGVH